MTKLDKPVESDYSDNPDMGFALVTNLPSGEGIGCGGGDGWGEEGRGSGTGYGEATGAFDGGTDGGEIYRQEVCLYEADGVGMINGHGKG